MSHLSEADKNYLLNSIREIEDFPKPGIKFKDITTLLGDAKAFTLLMDHLVERYSNIEIEKNKPRIKSFNMVKSE